MGETQDALEAPDEACDSLRRSRVVLAQSCWNEARDLQVHKLSLPAFCNIRVTVWSLRSSTIARRDRNTYGWADQ